MVPGNLIFAYAGARLPTLREISDEGLSSLLSPRLVAAFIAVGLFPLLARRVIRRVRGRST